MLQIIIVIVFVILFIALFVKYSGLFKHREYTVLPPIKGDGTNMNMCLDGCIRGTCKRTKNPTSKNCKYDYQCQYCQDKKTDMFYVDTDLDIEAEIKPIYEEEHMKKNKIDKLNKEIKKNNEYINVLNNKIHIMNS